MFERVLFYFRKICSIAHGSGNTKLISDFCVDFAVSHSLRYLKDEIGNVIIFKKASKGYEASPSVIIQGHLDMVCVKTDDCDIDFEKDGLRLSETDEFIEAIGTSLGADDGIAVAYALAILERDDLSHPALEVVFTVDEEIGMLGACALDTSPLRSKLLINIDSEQEGDLLASCAGGVRLDARFKAVCLPNSRPALKVTLSSLTGGHSGTEIDKGRLNAIITLSELLYAENIGLCSIDGGCADNAIPSSCSAVIICEHTQETTAALLDSFEKLKIKHTETDPDMKLSFEETVSDFVFSSSSASNLLKCITLIENAVISMSEDVRGLVKTSLNLGIIKTNGNAVTLSHALRSSSESEKDALCLRLEEHYKSYGATASFHGGYPAWEYKKDSVLRSTFLAAYRQQTGKDMTVSAIHAGLECGLFCGKIPGLDCISAGPDIYNIHTTDEKLSKRSAQRFYALMLSVLEKLK